METTELIQSVRTLQLALENAKELCQQALDEIEAAKKANRETNEIMDKIDETVRALFR